MRVIRWCEANQVDYVLGLARNDFLLKKAQKIRARTAGKMLASEQSVRGYGDFHHMPKSKTWARPRRVIAKPAYLTTFSPITRFFILINVL